MKKAFILIFFWSNLILAQVPSFNNVDRLDIAPTGDVRIVDVTVKQCNSINFRIKLRFNVALRN